MAARFTDSRSATATRARELRSRALELAEHELHAYEPVLAALRLPRDDPSRESRLRAALSHAAQSPLELLEAAAELAELGCELTHDGNPNLEGDALAGTLLAEAACAAATRLVEINLADILDDPRPAQARGLAARAGAARDRALR